MFPKPTPELQRVIAKLTDPSLVDANPLAKFNEYASRVKHRLQDDLKFSQPLYPDFEDYDYLHDTSESTPIYLNDYDLNMEEDRQRLAKLTRLEFNGNTFMNYAQCSPGCGVLTGNHLVGSGVTCPACGNTVELHYDKQHEVGLWIKCPEGVDAFVSHSFYNTFFSSICVMKQGATRIIIARYFMDPNYRREIKQKRVVTEMLLLNILKELGITDISMNGLYHHCEQLMAYFLSGPGIKHTGLKDRAIEAWTFWNRFKHKAFHHHLKVPSRFSTILEHNERGTWGVEGQTETKQIYYTIAGCKKSSEFYELTSADKKRNVGIVGAKIIELNDMYMRKLNKRQIFHKKAISRKHICSGNLPVTGRRVITSITGLVNPNQIVIPWKLAVSMLAVHITNELYRKGFTPLKAIRHLNVTAYKVDDVVNNFLQRMENERKILGESHRNPTNEYLSIKSFWVSVNRCLDDESLKISILACASYNADFDGDQMPIRICLDNESKAKAYGAFGHHQTLDKNIPFRVSGLAGMPATHLMNLNMMMHAIKTELDNEQL